MDASFVSLFLDAPRRVRTCIFPGLGAMKYPLHGDQERRRFQGCYNGYLQRHVVRGRRLLAVTQRQSNRAGRRFGTGALTVACAGQFPYIGCP